MEQLKECLTENELAQSIDYLTGECNCLDKRLQSHIENCQSCGKVVWELVIIISELEDWI